MTLSLSINKWVFTTDSKEMLTKLEDVFFRYFHYTIDDCVQTSQYSYFAGNIPVLLVAHIDTVHYALPSIIIHDRESKLVTSPQGLGADDRAGVWAILEILRKGHRPHVLFCDKEESGGVGARAAAKGLKEIIAAKKIRYAIELDREGADHMVFYGCDNPKFTKYVKSFGFTEHTGSFTDISVLCPEFGFAGVNLSVGYKEQHTKQEYLNLQHLEDTITKVCRMLSNVPKRRFAYIERAKTYYGLGSSYGGRRSSYNYYDDDEYGIYGYYNGYGGYSGYRSSGSALPAERLTNPEIPANASAKAGGTTTVIHRPGEAPKVLNKEYVLAFSMTPTDLQDYARVGTKEEWENILKANEQQIVADCYEAMFEAVLILVADILTNGEMEPEDIFPETGRR